MLERITRFWNWLKSLIGKGETDMPDETDTTLEIPAVSATAAAPAVIEAMIASIEPVPTPITDFDVVAEKIRSTFEKLGLPLHSAWAEVVAVAKKI